MNATQGYMTAADLDEIRRDYDLDLCPCCETPAGGTFDADDPGGDCADCGHGYEAHN